jgi:hypothetical protein
MGDERGEGRKKKKRVENEYCKGLLAKLSEASALFRWDLFRNPSNIDLTVETPTFVLITLVISCLAKANSRLLLLE